MVPGDHTELSDAEELVALARIRVGGLVDALVAQPIDRVTYAELSAWLDGPAWAACDALDELRSLSADEVRGRVLDVLRPTRWSPPIRLRQQLDGPR